MANVPTFPVSIANAVALINNASSTNKVTVRAGSTNGDKIESICLTSTDSSARVLNVIITVSAVDYQIGTINVPINAGTDAASTAAVSLLENNSMMPFIRKDSNGRPYLYLANGSTLSLSAQVAVTSGRQINVFAQIGAY